MEVIAQKLSDILASLQPLTVEWQDDTSRRVIESLKRLRVKKVYTTDDVEVLLDQHFEDGMLICRLFLGQSKDQFVAVFKSIRQGRGIGVKTYRAERTRSSRTYSARGYSKRWPTRPIASATGAMFLLSD